MKKIISGILLVLSMVFLVSCGSESKETSSNADSVPTINISWGNELHTGFMDIPLKNPEAFKDKSVQLKSLSKEQFELIKDGKKIALFNIVPTKGGSEMATLMGQKHIDAGFCSNTAMLTAADKGTDVKILSPVQTDGVALVFSPDKDFYGWDKVKKYIADSKIPVKIGYHSPISGPRIVIESVLKKEGFKVTEDPADSKADVLLVDLKGSKNLLPSLSSKQVDAWVGPSHHPEAAEDSGVGKIVLNLKDFPPKGQWEDFPCCVFSAREESLKQNPEVYKAFVEVVKYTTEFANTNKDVVAKTLASSIGVEEGTIKKCTIKYTTNPDEKWLSGIKVYYDAISEMGKFDGEFKGKSFDEIKDKMFDFSYLK
ncbi:MAG: ABC transporter substrate-binding protein [Clostridium sp.]